jgi:ornithine cyclodeaminase
MTTVVGLQQINAALAGVDVVAAMARAFSAYSAGQAVVPPVAELLFDEPPGDVHIKYGYVRGEDYYVIKVASGFYRNPRLGLHAGNGLMLLFRQRTGELVAILLDEGRLTEIRTAAAGALAARYLAPPQVDCIGILGTGTQAEAQLRQLAAVVDCRRVLVCGRREAAMSDYRERLQDTEFHIQATRDPGELCARCQLIVTTTPATAPLIHAVGPGTHITAVGSDTPDKHELSPAILAGADKVVVDSRAQAASRGEVFQAVRAGSIELQTVVELGEIINGSARGRTDDQQVTVADLTGIATQDIEIASAVYRGVQDAD